MRLHLLDAWHELRLYSDRERAALAWAELLTNISTSRAPDAVYEQARKQFSEKELADLSIVIAMVNAWNRLAIGAGPCTPPTAPKLLEQPDSLRTAGGIDLFAVVKRSSA